MAMHARCFIPPLSSCGYILATSAESPTDSRSPSMRSSSSRSRDPDSCALMVSANCCPMRMTGLSEFIAPCGMRAICAKRAWRISSSDSSSMSTPSRSALPPVISPGGSISRMSANAVVVLPDPDSPTSPNRSPGLRVKVTPSTAFIGPRGVPYCTRKSSTWRTPPASTAPASPSSGDGVEVSASALSFCVRVIMVSVAPQPWIGKSVEAYR